MFLLKKILFFTALVVSVYCTYAKDNDGEFYFYSSEDVSAIKSSASTEWGKKIIHALQDKVAERRTHSLEVPTLEGGHIHQYFCPVHNVMFEFSWDSPKAHYCRACDKKWSGNPQYDWAWVNMVHDNNMGYMVANMYLYMATGDTTYAGYIRDMMLDYASKYPAYKLHSSEPGVVNSSSGRMFAQCLDESVWISDAARAYQVAKDVMTPEQIEYIENGILRPCADMLSSSKLALNWQVWLNSGISALGVALEDDSLIDIAINYPKHGYHFLMDAHVNDDGWWNEGSPIYHFYPLRAMLLTADAVRCRGINLFDKKLYDMFASPVRGAYADLSFPAHNDGWYGENLMAQVKLYEIVYARYKDPLFMEVLKECYKKCDRINPEALLNFTGMDVATAAPAKESFLFPDTGYGILRSGDRSVVLKYGPHGGGHGHFDKLSISVYDGKKEIVSDLGTSAYGVPDYREWYRKTLGHNTVVVDGEDQKAATGKLLTFDKTLDGGTISAIVDEAYDDVVMERAVKLEKNSLTDIYSCHSDRIRQYDYVLLFNDKPQMKVSGKPADLGDGSGYVKIVNEQSFSPKNKFSVKAGDAKIGFDIPEGVDFEVFIGEAPGIPPTNPGVVTKEGTEKRPVQTCYPFIIRIKDKNMNVKANWSI